MLDERADSEVNSTRFERANGLGRGKMRDRERHVGCTFLEHVQQLREKQNLVQVSHAYGECVRSGLRVEPGALCEQPVHLSYGLTYRLHPFQRLCCWFETG